MAFDTDDEIETDAPLRGEGDVEAGMSKLRETISMYRSEFGADGRSEAALAELRELEDCRLMLRLALTGFSVSGKNSDRAWFFYGPNAADNVIVDKLNPKLTDEQRAVLLKACGE